MESIRSAVIAVPSRRETKSVERSITMGEGAAAPASNNFPTGRESGWISCRS